VINDNIIEQVTDFGYLVYRISEYGSDLEDKLQTYNKINGVIQRHFGKQINKETKLRIHKITAQAALKFGSDEEKRGTAFRSSTDEIFETITIIIIYTETFWKTNEQRNKVKNSQHYSSSGIEIWM